MNLYGSLINVIHQKNKGLSGARNAGIDLATGDYLSFIDSDDYIEPKMIESMIDLAEKNNAEIVVCGRFDEYSDRSVPSFTLDYNKIFDSEQTISKILTWDSIDIAAWDKLYKKALWEGLRFPEGYNNEDICIIPTIIRRANRIVHTGQAYYHYCHRPNSITTSYSRKRISDFYRAIQEMNKQVLLFYPSIVDELVYYNNRSYLALLMMCENAKLKRISERKESFLYLKKHWHNKFSLSRMTRREKVLFTLFRTHLYGFVKQMSKKRRNSSA